MKLGSLFDGSGTAPLAASMCGIEPVWASEIEPYPIKVTKARFPNMLHLGDITKIDGAAVEPVDIICGGSPCQDLSVAGKQAGLHDGERSHLFFEMTRIIKQMREATDGKYPRYIIWENVPGAFSSNKGKDFFAVLQAFAEIADSNVHVPEPEKRKGTDRLAWQYAGEVVGDGWSIAWRTVDAQYWGVPQRRRRIYLVADLAAECAGEILFERKGMSGDSEPRREERKETAGDAGRSIEGSGGNRICAGICETEESICRRDENQNRNGNESTSRFDFRETNGTGMSEGAIGRVNCLTPWDCQSKRIYNIDGAYRTLDAGQAIAGQAHGIVYALQGNGINRADTAGCSGAGWREGECYTLNTIDRPAVVYDITGVTSNSMKSPTPDSCFKRRDIGRTLDSFVGSPECNQGGMVVVKSIDCRNMVLNDELSGTLQAKDNGGQSLNYQNPVVYDARCVGNGQLNQMSMAEQANCLDCMHDQQAVIHDGKPPREYIIRRLTPLECCRLQGFPDWWEDGVEGSDSARYKMWGNGMALPNMLHVMRGIARMEVNHDQT